jgi:tetratricopeptide (TPR) repeat protein
MNKNLLSFLFHILLGSPAVMAADTACFAEANARFKAGDFAVAATAYETLLANGGPRASVFYNLGNSYHRLGQYGPAILAYERARLLTPRDPDLLANLALARKAAAAFEETVVHPRLDALICYPSRNEWSWLVAGAALFVGGLALVCGLVNLPRRGMRQAALASAGLASLAIAAGSACLYLRRDESNRGIVLSENAAVHLSPFETAASLGTPGPGRIVHMRKESGGFHYVEVPGTTLRGWLPDKEVGAITPSKDGK